MTGIDMARVKDRADKLVVSLMTARADPGLCGQIMKDAITEAADTDDGKREIGAIFMRAMGGLVGAVNADSVMIDATFGPGAYNQMVQSIALWLAQDRQR